MLKPDEAAAAFPGAVSATRRARVPDQASPGGSREAASGVGHGDTLALHGVAACLFLYVSSVNLGENARFPGFLGLNSFSLHPFLLFVSE